MFKVRVVVILRKKVGYDCKGYEYSLKDVGNVFFLDLVVVIWVFIS